jgi:hypothetical protein
MTPRSRVKLQGSKVDMEWGGHWETLGSMAEWSGTGGEAERKRCTWQSLL